MFHFTEKYPEAAGLLPLFLDRDDPRPAREQIHESYAHGGGWHEFTGFTPHIDWADPLKSYLSYPDDPPMRAIAFALFGEELVLLFQHSWCAIVQPDLSTDVARLD